MSRNKIIEGAKEALAVARGEQPAARITVQGHAYVPESELAALRERVQELEGSIALLDERSAQYERGMKDAERKLAEADGEPTTAMIDAGVAFALNVSLSGEYRWSQYVSDLYKTMRRAARAIMEE